MIKDMNKINLVWAVIWTATFIFCVIGFFWNPSHVFTAIICAFFAAMFWHDYRKTKGL